MKKKTIAVTALAIIAACLISCASNEQAPKTDNSGTYKNRAKEIVTNSSYELVIGTSVQP